MKLKTILFLREIIKELGSTVVGAPVLQALSPFAASLQAVYSGALSITKSPKKLPTVNICISFPQHSTHKSLPKSFPAMTQTYSVISGLFGCKNATEHIKLDFVHYQSTIDSSMFICLTIYLREK